MDGANLGYAIFRRRTTSLGIWRIVEVMGAFAQHV